MRVQLDTDALYVALDRLRRDRHMSWREVAEQADVPASTLTHIGHGMGLSARYGTVLPESATAAPVGGHVPGPAHTLGRRAGTGRKYLTRGS